MKKLLFLTIFITATLISSVAVSAQQRETVLTGKVSLMLPTSVKVLDEYMSSQLYSGGAVFTGMNVRLGAFYRKHDNLSWDLYYTDFQRTKGRDNDPEGDKLANPANTQRLKWEVYNFGYGTYYHWQFGERFMLKTGGQFDVYGAMKQTVPDGVNNFINLEGQIMLKSHTAIKYGWAFKKWGLDLRALLTLPVIGVITADHPSEPALTLVAKNDHSVLNPEYKHIFMGWYHNFMSLDYEFAVDFVLKPCTLTLGFGSSNKWWNVYDVQNIRKIGYTTLGVAFDIAPRKKFNSSNKNF